MNNSNRTSLTSYYNHYLQRGIYINTKFWITHIFLYYNAGICDNEYNHKEIIESFMVSTTKWITYSYSSF